MRYACCSLASLLLLAATSSHQPRTTAPAVASVAGTAPLPREEAVLLRPVLRVAQAGRASRAGESRGRVAR